MTQGHYKSTVKTSVEFNIPAGRVGKWTTPGTRPRLQTRNGNGNGNQKTEHGKLQTGDGEQGSGEQKRETVNSRTWKGNWPNGKGGSGSDGSVTPAWPFPEQGPHHFRVDWADAWAAARTAARVRHHRRRDGSDQAQ